MRKYNYGDVVCGRSAGMSEKVGSNDFEVWWPTVGQTIGKAAAWQAWQHQQEEIERLRYQLEEVETLKHQLQKAHQCPATTLNGEYGEERLRCTKPAGHGWFHRFEERVSRF
jgi:hypothetical protein